MNDISCCSTHTIGAQSTLHHQLIPYRWEIKPDSRKVISFICQQCFELIHMDDVHEWRSKKNSGTCE